MTVSAIKDGNNTNGRAGPHIFRFAGSDISLSDLLEREVYPRLDAKTIYSHPAHQWKEELFDKIKGGCPWHQSQSGTAFYVNTKNMLWRCPVCGGGSPIQYRWRLRGRAGSPRGEDFIAVAKELCDLAGVAMPERELSPEAKRRAQRREVRRAILEAVELHCHDFLISPAGDAARAYLLERGFNDAAIRELRLGLYPSCTELNRMLREKNFDKEDVNTTGVVFKRMEDYIIFPWRDDRGAPLTLYGTWSGRMPPEGKPKKMALPNPTDNKKVEEQTKRSPMYLDRALVANCTHVCVLEGVTDAALAQISGDNSAVACVAAELSREQVETLRRRGIRSVTIALDPDSAGDAGIASCIRQLRAVEIQVYVAPRLPDEMDPDEFVLAKGIAAWKALTANADHAFRWQPRQILAGHTLPPKSDIEADRIVQESLVYAAKQPASADEELLRYFWPEIAQAVNSSASALHAKVQAMRSSTSGGKSHGTEAPKSSLNGMPPSLPRINASEGNLAIVTAHAWDALQKGNVPPTLFRYGGNPARIEADDDGNPLVRAMTPDRMRHRLARDAYWYSIVKDSEEPVHPPIAVVRDVLAVPDPPLPPLTRIVGCPVFAADGTLQTTPGYSAASKTYFVPDAGFMVPDVSSCPSTAEVQEAKRLLMQELMGQFPFVADADRAHALCAALLPFGRELIHGPTPIHDFEAPGPGTGKTLLCEAGMLPALGRPATAMTEGKDEDEWRKRLLAKLMSAPSVVFTDNVRRRVDASSLASAVTAYPLWEDRLLGKSEIIRVPVRCAWILTGNNPAFSSEMTRRTVRIRLDAKQDQPWLRTGFQHPSLIEWATENRGRLVWAALSLIQAWIAADRPRGNSVLGMFEAWAHVMGGILDIAEVPGFLGNLQDFYANADTEGECWRVFVLAWWKTHSDNEVKASELYCIAIEAGMQLGDKSEQSQKVRLGQKIAEARDRVFRVEKENFRIEKAGEKQRATVWKVVRLSESVSQSESFGQCVRETEPEYTWDEKDSPSLTDSPMEESSYDDDGFTPL
jgi:DNA primase catalytic core